jgi:uncharacterized protein (TIGR02466 family)
VQDNLKRPFMKKNKTSTSKKSPTSNNKEPVLVVGDQNSVSPVLENSQNDQVQKYGYFITPIYHIKKPEFLPTVRKLSDKLLAEHKKEVPELHPVYPVRQTGSMLSDESVKEFADFVGGTAWNAMMSEGYDMDQFSVVFQEMWVQEHQKHSGHDEHVHPYGSQLIGFYFINAPEDSGKLVFHDPRPAKRQINLPEADMHMATDASTAIHFVPVAGDLYFAPSWVPHSISRHTGDTPLTLVHITLSVIPNQNPPKIQQETSAVTVI